MPTSWSLMYPWGNIRAAMTVLWSSIIYSDFHKLRPKVCDIVLDAQSVLVSLNCLIGIKTKFEAQVAFLAVRQPTPIIKSASLFRAARRGGSFYFQRRFSTAMTVLDLWRANLRKSALNHPYDSRLSFWGYVAHFVRCDDNDDYSFW